MKPIDIPALAKRHSIRKELAAPDFFEGALLGNGNLGVVVCTRPDAIVLHFGHNDIWDIRIEEGHADKIGTFREICGNIQSAPGDIHKEEWYQNYVEEVTASYLNYKYPRPYPASTMHLFFDRKEYEVMGHELDISTGLLTVTLENSREERFFIHVFVSQESDRVYCRTVDSEGRAYPLFHRLHLWPHEPDEGLPQYTVLPNGFSQVLPHNDYTGEVRPGVDKGFSLLYSHNGTAAAPGLKTGVAGMTEIVMQLTEGYFDAVSAVTDVEALPFAQALQQAKTAWMQYWNRSGIALEDEFLEHLWYTNTYFIRCVLNVKSRCPGLFGNWMYEDIGTAWHGDYHMNYNTQQLFWGLMGANRQELHLPYVRLAEELMPLSSAWARDFYEMEGACFPHSAYPVPMSVMPYPSPDWGWEILETPWTVQSLWWHYTYTKDTELLRTRLYPVLRAAAAFLADYMTREGANPNGDDKYHLFPTIVPEMYGLTEGFEKNLDGAVDLALTKFVFRAVLQAVEDLLLQQEEAVLTEKLRKILAAYPDYPTAQSRWGEVYVSVRSEDPDTVIYNCPANLVQIFPGEDVDARSATEAELTLARNSWQHHYNEGGNDLVFYYLIGARLGCLDLEKFKRHVRYCLLPNETATDRVTLSGGRYWDNINADFMARMGIWVENFSLYAVINECLLWGHRDTAVLFPNWDKKKAASFRSLRTKGAFLVDAACRNGRVEYVKVRSEQGGTWQMENPWPAAADSRGNVYLSDLIDIPMKPGEELLLQRHRKEPL